MKNVKAGKKQREKLWGPFFRFYTRFRIPWHLYLFAIALGIAAGAITLQVAKVMIRVNKGELYNAVILAYVGWLLLQSIVNGAAEVFNSYATGKVTMRSQNVIWQKIVSLTMRDVDAEGASNLISCVTNDTSKAAVTLQMVFSMVSSGYTYIRAWAILVQYNSELSLILIFSIPIVLIMFFAVGKLEFFSMRKAYEALNTMTSFFSEHVACAKHVKAQSMEDREVEAGYTAINSRYKADIIVQLASAAQVLIHSVYVNLSSILIAVRGSALIRDGKLESTGINNFMTYTTSVQKYQAELLTQFQNIKGTQGSLRHVNAVLARNEEALNTGKPIEKAGDIELKHVRFSFDGEYQVLQDVSFTIPYGKRTAIIGGNGSGKSTVMKLLQGFYQPDSGMITLGGQDLKESKLSDLRGMFAYVLQNSPMFSGTVRDNLTYGARSEVTEEEMITAARLACADDFIRALPNGYDTEVGSDASRLSGGQRQRLAIARALLVKPKYLILDEATASLDHQSGGEVLKNIFGGDEVPTVIYISHNMAEVLSADYAVVMKNGEVEATGTPGELWKTSETFRDYLTKQQLEVTA